PQVEVAVADAQCLVDPLFVELEGQHLAGGQQLELVDDQLDVSRLQLRVARRLAARDELAARAHDALEPQGPRAGATRTGSGKACATAGAAGECSGSITSCTSPVRSRRSMNTRPPWSRR